MTNLIECAYCGEKSSKKCTGCMSVVYCTKQHQKLHWDQHKALCKCYTVAVNSQLGRHLCATRNIQQGEIILKEAPLIYGPKIASYPICLGCHRLLPAPQQPSNKLYKCSKCDWPLCGVECENADSHLAECKLMSARRFLTKIDYNAQSPKKESAYSVILPLRCLLLAQSDAQKYAKFAALEDHLEERLNTPLYKVLSANLLTFYKTVLRIDDPKWTEQEILRIAARLDTNCFEVRQPHLGRKLRAIYLNASMISHDCCSNARHTFDDAMQIIFIAKQPIAKGQIISTSYTQPLKCTLMRREHLRLSKCFDCCCARCADPTELGLFTGAIYCNKCKIGKMISTAALDKNASWKCQLCVNEIDAKQMHFGHGCIMKEMQALTPNSPHPFEDFLLRNRHYLPETNSYVLQVKYALTQIYGNIPGFSLNELDDATVKRKINLCEELLEVANVVDSGASIFRGNLLLYLQEAQVVLAKREYEAGTLTRDALKERLEEAMKLLKEAVEIMKYEPDMQELLVKRTLQINKELEQCSPSDMQYVQDFDSAFTTTQK